jgi:hypothetical protein
MRSLLNGKRSGDADGKVTSIVPGSGDSVGAEAEVVSGPGQQV